MNLKAILPAFLLSALTQYSIAMPMVQTVACSDDASALCATGVTGLGVLGTLYDVTFSSDAYADIFESEDPTFLFDQASATAAQVALADVLGLASVEGLTEGLIQSSFLVPFGLSDFSGFDESISETGFHTGDGEWETDSLPWFAPILNPVGPRNAYALFEPSPSNPMPLPASVLLLLMGLTSLTVVRRRALREN